MYKRKLRGWAKHLDFLIADLICLQLALFLAYYMRHGILDIYTRSLYVNIAIVMTLLDMLIIIFFNVLKNILKRNNITEMIKVIEKSLLLMVVSTAYIFYAQKDDVSRLTLGFTCVFDAMFTYIVHCVMKPIVRRRRKNNKKSLIVITESEFIDSITENKKIFGLDEYQSVGFAVLDKNMEGQKSNGWSIVASQDTVIDYVLRQWMDEALVILPREDVFSTSLVKDLAEMGLAVHVEISEYNSLKGYRKQFERMGENQVLTVSMNSINEYDWIAKRILDILGGLVGCLITLILTIFLGPAIFIASPGPIFFKQKRVGRNGKVFNMYKFRSMYMDAEERKKELMAQNRVKDGMMFKLEYDPRIIGCKKKADGTIKKGVGNFIRDWSLDEFPQFFNVLKGDMSLVGTRPPTLDEWNKYELRHRARLAFKPGITGLWQVSGRSNITDFEEIARLDKEYIKNWRFSHDIQILLKTVQVVFKKEGSM